MTEIIPAIMPKNWDDLRAYVASVEPLVSAVQIDVMDGQFVPSVDWPYIEDTEEIFEKMNTGGICFNDIAPISYEIDLMVENPITHANNWISAGASRLIFHIEGIDYADGLFMEISRDGIEIGLAMNPDTPNEIVEPHIHTIDFIQCMGISRIGYQGEHFDKRVIEKLKYFRAKFPYLILSVDGGVSLETATSLVLAGANRLVSGSAIWKSDDIIKTIKTFQAI